MIRLSETKTLDNYFIDENGVITDLNGTVQKIDGKIRPYFKSVGIHQIQMWTNYGYRDTKIWDIHHLDENPLNNSLSNLVYLTRSEHTRLHKKGAHWSLSEETKEKIRRANLGSHHSEESKIKIGLGHKGRMRTEETKQKISDSTKGKNTWIKEYRWFNDGVKNYRCKECPPGCVKGRLKNK